MIRRTVILWLNGLVTEPGADSSPEYLIRSSVFSHTASENILLWSCMSSCRSDEFQNFVRRLPTLYALNMSAIQYFWKMEPAILQRYKQLELSTQQLVSKAHRIINKIFTLSKRCRSQPKIIRLRERWGADAYFCWPFWCTRAWLCMKEEKLSPPGGTTQVPSNRLWTVVLI